MTGGKDDTLRASKISGGNMKKVRLLALLLIAVTLFSFTSCDNTTPAERFAQLKEAMPYASLLEIDVKGKQSTGTYSWDLTEFSTDTNMRNTLSAVVEDYLSITKTPYTPGTDTVEIKAASGKIENTFVREASVEYKAKNVNITYTAVDSEGKTITSGTLTLDGSIYSSSSASENETSATVEMGATNVTVNGVGYGSFTISMVASASESGEPTYTVTGTYDGKEVDSNLLKEYMMEIL